MKALTCAAARRRLDAFHDDELPIGDQIAVSAHLDWCDACAASVGELRRLRAALRASTPGRVGVHAVSAVSDEEARSLQVRVVSRAKVERRFSLRTRVHEVFDDMHLVYGFAGATAAAAVCAIVMFTMMRFATDERPGSFGEIVRVLALNSRSAMNPVDIDAHVRMPRVLDQPFTLPVLPPTPRGADTFVMLAGVVTREGRIANLELLKAPGPVGRAPGTAEAQAVSDLMGSIAKARFEPARVDGQPVAVNMVWLRLITHTTVRGRRAPVNVTVTVTPTVTDPVAVPAQGTQGFVAPARTGVIGA